MKPYYFLLLLLLISSCRKDSESLIPSDSPFDPEIEIVDDFDPVSIPVTASVLGKVLNKNGYPIADALVTLGEEIISTNEQGVFLFKSVAMNAAGTFVKAQKELSHFEGGSRFFPKENSENYVTIRLLPKLEHSRFNVAEGTTINVEGGTQLAIEPNSLLRQNGNLYTGEVSVYPQLLAPNEKHFLEFMPGNLQGINRQSKEVALMTYGLLAIELRSSNGEILKLDRETPAKLSYAVIDEQLALAPAELPFWSFNTVYGLWQDRGDAFLVGDKYVSEITNLSFCHLAEAAPMINIQGRLQTEEGLPMPNLLVQTNDYSTLEGAYAYTDNDGFFSTNIPADKITDIILSVNGVGCINWPLESAQYLEDESLNNIIITEGASTQIATLVGTLVDCTDNAINEFFIDVNEGENAYCYYQLDGNELGIALPVCMANTTFSVAVRDLVNFHESGAMIYDLDADLGLLELCGDGEADFIIIKFPGSDAIVFDEPTLLMGNITKIIGDEDSLNQIDISFFGSTTGTYMTMRLAYLKVPSLPMEQQ
ncbi:MAG: hypothetical protein ACI956_001791 [Nonlabens sp.]|jgi:hypothetical protein